MFCGSSHLPGVESPGMLKEPQASRRTYSSGVRNTLRVRTSWRVAFDALQALIEVLQFKNAPTKEWSTDQCEMSLGWIDSGAWVGEILELG